MSSEFLPFALPEIGEAEIAEVVDSLRSGWITTGPKTQRFESQFTALMGEDLYSVAVNSATAGLHLALEATGIQSDDEVITTPFTFTASAEVIRYFGANPVFVDIDPKTFNIDPEHIQSAISPRTKAILPVHFAGQACDMGRIMSISQQNRLKVIEDAAHALPTSAHGRLIGSLDSDATVFSFYATKTITTGEGGMIITRNKEMALRMRSMRLHGINQDVFDRYRSKKPSWYYEVVAPGYKYNMTDIAAAIGIHQLIKVWDFQKRRQRISECYNEAFEGLPLHQPYVVRSEDTHAWHLYVIQLELELLKIDRDRFIELMAEAGIGTSVHFIPLHIQPYWRDRYKFKPHDFPVAYDVYQRAVSLPIYPKMTDGDVEHVINAVRKILVTYSK